MKEPIKWQNYVFYMNGLILGEYGRYEEAIDEFSKAIPHNQED